MDTKGVFRTRESFIDESTHKTSSSSAPSTKRTLTFWVLLGCAQFAGLISIALLIYWASLYGGFGWQIAGRQLFLHALLMVLGLVFCYGNAILIYRVLHFLPKPMLKYMHAALHVLAIVLSIVGLVAIFDNRRKTGSSHFFSIHSWLGIATFSLFCLQYVGSFLTFLFPGLPTTIRATVMPFHTFFGVGLFILAVASAELGLTQRLVWTGGYTSSKFIPEKGAGNFLGLFMVVFAFLVVYIVTRSSYKRQPRSDEIPAPTN